MAITAINARICRCMGISASVREPWILEECAGANPQSSQEPYLGILLEAWYGCDQPTIKRRNTMRAWLRCAPLLTAFVVPLPSNAQQQFPATLAGHAFIPAQAHLLPPPQDAPAAFAIAGKYTGPGWRRVDAVGTIPGTSYISDPAAPRPTGVPTPFRGQPLQGFSGIKTMPDGTFWVTTDNGFGAKKEI